MTEKVRKLSVFLQALSRIPGLGFLRDTEYQMREAVDAVDDMGDQVDEVKRQADDVRRGAHDVVRQEDED